MEWFDNVQGLQHVGIPTDDIEQTIEFYTSLGFVIAFKTFNEKSNEKVAFLKLRNVTIETYQNNNAAHKRGAIDHIAFNVLDIDEAFNKITHSDYKMIDDSIHFLPFWENGVRYFNIEGPNGEIIEFSQYL